MAISHVLKYSDLLEDMKSFKFDMFEFQEKCGRPNCLPIVTTYSLMQLDLLNLVDQEKMPAFCHKIYNTYRQDVEYHNDLHGSDVLQMCFYMLTTGGLETALKLSKIDMITFLISAVCHDVGHDGFTNSFHVNKITKRAIDFNDKSVQESFHVATTFQILDEDQFNITGKLTKEEFKLFRKNAIGLILATDMAQHNSHLSLATSILDTNEIKDGKNVEKLFSSKDELENYKLRQ